MSFTFPYFDKEQIKMEIYLEKENEPTPAHLIANGSCTLTVRNEST